MCGKARYPGRRKISHWRDFLRRSRRDFLTVSQKLLPGEADSVVIAGMGGELIIKILENGRHMWDSVKQWVLSPQSEIFKVRRWLFENGFVIRKEDMVLEDGKFYTVMDVRRERRRF